MNIGLWFALAVVYSLDATLWVRGEELLIEAMCTEYLGITGWHFFWIIAVEIFTLVLLLRPFFEARLTHDLDYVAAMRHHLMPHAAFFLSYAAHFWMVFLLAGLSRILVSDDINKVRYMTLPVAGSPRPLPEMPPLLALVVAIASGPSRSTSSDSLPSRYHSSIRHFMMGARLLLSAHNVANNILFFIAISREANGPPKFAPAVSITSLDGDTHMNRRTRKRRAR